MIYKIKNKKKIQNNKILSKLFKNHYNNLSKVHKNNYKIRILNKNQILYKNNKVRNKLNMIHFNNLFR
mgnify:CR=1 FL=1